MAKKNRTGLQSEVSHIFAGVPIPKRKPPHSKHTDKKPESQDPEQTAPAEKLSPEEIPVRKPPEQQPIQPKVSAEKTPVPESGAAESSPPKLPARQEPIKEASVEKMIAPQSQIEPAPVGRPPVVEPPIEQSPVSYSQAIEIPEIEDSAERPRQTPTVKPIMGSVIEQSAVKTTRKKPVISKGKLITSKKSGISSRRQTTMVVLVIALSILLFYLLVIKPLRSSRGPARSASNISSLPDPSFGANVEDVVIDWLAPSEYPKDIRDPMLPISDQQLYSETGTPVIAGISSSNEGEKLAIIRGTGELVREGDEIFGWKVITINPNSVIFEKDGETLKLEPQGKK